MHGVFLKRVRASSSAWMSDEFALPQLATTLSAGGLLYFMEIILIVSFAALIFSGRLSGSLPVGLSLLIAGDAVICGGVALLSSFSGSIAVSQDTSAVMVAAIAATLVNGLPPGVSPAQQIATVVVTLVATTLTTGLFFLLLGVFKMGGLVRFMPYPVMGGYLAGTGWLLFTGGLSVMTPRALTAAMFQPEQIPHWLPGLLLGAVLLIASLRAANPLTLPGIIVLAAALFYVAAWISDSSLSRVSAGGWLLGPFPPHSGWQFPLSPTLVGQVHWPALLDQTPGIASLLLVNVISLLLNVSGLELVVKKDVDLNRELVITGVSNIGTGLVGGAPGYVAISLSALNQTLSGGRRMAGIVVSLLLGITLAVGVTALTNMPRLVVGALLVYLGFDFLFEWLYRAWFRFPWVDYLVVVLIFGVIAIRGLLDGIAVGLILTTVLFVVNYSRVSVIKYSMSGLSFRSRLRRNLPQQELLDRHGAQLYILVLHGFIFFGTANALFEKFRARTARRDMQPLRFAALDFSHVTGLDSTALLSFSRILQIAQEENIFLVLTGFQGHVREQFAKSDFGQHPNMHLFPDLDRGVEWCENQIIASQLTIDEGAASLAEKLAALTMNRSEVDRVISYMSRAELAPGQYLIQQGDEADALYFIESGQVSAYLESPGREPVRLETMRGGRVVGELAFYLHSPRTAAVVVDEPSTIYSLSLEQLELLEESDPAAAGVFHSIMARLLADRVVHLIRTVDALQQ